MKSTAEVINLGANKSHTEIQQASAAIVSRLESDARRAIETVLIVGANLSRIRKAVEDPACGYEGRNPDQRFGNAVEKEILSVGHALHTTHRSTLYDYRTIYETFDSQRERVIAANVSQRKLLEFAKAEDPQAALNDFLVTPQQAKSRKAEKAKTKTPSVNNNTTEKANEILDAIANGAPVPNTAEEIQEMTGLARTASQEVWRIVRFCLARDEVRPASELNLAPVARDDLSESEQKRLDRVIKQELKKLQDGFHQAVKKEYQEFVARAHSDWKRKIEFAEKYADGTRREKFPFTRKQFKELLFFTHPDRQEETLRARAAEIFSAIKSKQDSLVMPEPPTGGVPFPATAEDLLKARS